MEPLEEAVPASVALLGSLRRDRLLYSCSVIEPYLEVTNSETGGIELANVATIRHYGWRGGGSAGRVADASVGPGE